MVQLALTSNYRLVILGLCEAAPECFILFLNGFLCLYKLCVQLNTFANNASTLMHLNSKLKTNHNGCLDTGFTLVNDLDKFVYHKNTCLTCMQGVDDLMFED